MSQPEQDPTLRLINEIAATMGGAAVNAELSQAAQPFVHPSQPQGAAGEARVRPDNTGLDENEVYRGLADELLLEAGKDASPGARDALAKVIGAGIVSGLLREDGKNDPTSGVLSEVRTALRQGGLLAELQQADAIQPQDDPAAARMGPIARWRHTRRTNAAIREGQERRYAERQNELKRLRVQTLEQGYIGTGGFKPGDAVTLTMNTPDVEVLGPKCDLKLTVDAYEEGKDGKPSGVRCTVVEESRRDQRAFKHDPLPAGASIVLRCTALAANDHIRNQDRMTKDETPVVYWEGQRMPLTTVYKWQSSTGPHQRDSALRIKQLTVNGVEMFAKDE